MSKYPYGKQWIDEDDINAVAEALRGEYLTGGKYIAEFEAAFAERTGARYAVAVSNGTAALHIAYMATGLTSGDEIITTALTFAATANAALYCNARPVFADIDPTGNIDVSLIEKAITPSTRLIAPVHYAGQPARMAEIHKLAEKHNLFIVEDACHALGAFDGKDKVGSCAHSDMAVFSLHPVKHITTGEGGVVTTNNKALYERLKLLRSHGITSEQPWKKDMRLLGYNYRITDIQCALGSSQLKRLDMFLQERRRVAACYDVLLKGNKFFNALERRDDMKHAYHLYPVLLNEAIDRDSFMEKAHQAGVGLQVHYGAVYQHRYYQQNGYEGLSLPVTDDISSRVLSLPIYPQLTDDNVAEIVQILNSIAEQA